MNIGDLFQRLSFGELSNLSIGMDGAGEIAVESHNKVASYVEKALTQIYARFAHKRHYVTFVAAENRTLYHLSTEDSALQLADGEELPRPFKIVDVARLDDPTTPRIDEFQQLGINEGRSPFEVHILSQNSFRVPRAKAGDLLQVEYRIRHPKISIPVDLNQDIEIEPALEEALELHVAAQVYSAMNGEQNLLKSRELRASYQEVCALIDAGDLLNETSNEQHDRLRAGGWV